MWRALAEFIGRVLKELLPSIIAEWRKPRRTRYVGPNKDVQEDIAKSIEEQMQEAMDEEATFDDDGDAYLYHTLHRGMPRTQPGQDSETPGQSNADRGDSEELG